MNLTPYEFEKARDGDLFVKQGDKLVAVSPSSLTAELKKELQKVPELEQELKVVGKHITKLEKLAKKHFIIVFTLFELKALKGEIEVEEELLSLDEKVISGEMAVEEAVNKHEYLQKTFNALFREGK